MCNGEKVSATSTDVCPLESLPSLGLTRICPVSSVPPGSTFPYTGWVTNTGNVTLTNVIVLSSQPAANTVVLGPIDLAPGQIENFSGSYVVPPNGNPSLDTVTATGTDTCGGATVKVAANCLGIVPLSLPVIGPLNSASGAIRISWTTTPGVTYMLQYKAHLSDPTWTTLPGAITASGNVTSIMDPGATDGERYYRVMVVQ
jgi:uncharacterized repeat protein (TIGR01451 family)